MSSEQAIYDRGLVDETLGAARRRGLIYEKDGALWLRTTEFGDDKDRVLRKSDGTLTYLVPDIAYHVDKHERADSTGRSTSGAPIITATSPGCAPRSGPSAIPTNSSRSSWSSW